MYEKYIYIYSERERERERAISLWPGLSIEELKHYMISYRGYMYLVLFSIIYIYNHIEFKYGRYHGIGSLKVGARSDPSTRGAIKLLLLQGFQRLPHIFPTFPLPGASADVVHDATLVPVFVCRQKHVIKMLHDMRSSLDPVGKTPLQDIAARAFI